MIEFAIRDSNEDAYIELNKLLKATQLCESGSMANHFIVEGMVIHNGEVDTRKRAKIRRGDEVEFEGTVIKVI